MPRSVMEHSFAEVPRAEIPRSSFNRSHGLKTAFDADYLIPVLLDDVVPGDTVNCDMHFFGRLASPPLFPIMDNLHMESFFFFVPYRLVWDNWEKMHGAQDDPSDSIDFTVPQMNGGNTYVVGDLADYFGLPANINTDEGISCLPFRAYRLIWNEWFRDQNLQDSVDLVTDDGPDTNAETGFQDVPLKRGKRHDYFTSCLPSPQKGDSVGLGFATDAVVLPGATEHTTTAYANRIAFRDGASGAYPTSGREVLFGPTGGIEQATTSGTSGGNRVYPSNLYADLSSSSAVNINDLRLAFQTQRLLERDARSGTRYNEMILAHFGVTVPDFRVQRPEFLGGGSSPVNITPVAQTTYQGTQTIEDAKGALSGFGTVSGRHGFTKSFTEHGMLIGLVNVRGDITYQQGIDRYWKKDSRYDFYYPVLAQIGEQSVPSYEIYYDGTANDDNIFGYQERYAEYRYKPSRLTGIMRSNVAGTLESWHLSEDFASRPTLGSSFIESNTGTPLDRALSVPSEPHMICDFYFEYKWARPMPVYGVPGNLDHF